MRSTCTWCRLRTCHWQQLAAKWLLNITQTDYFGSFDPSNQANKQFLLIRLYKQYGLFVQLLDKHSHVDGTVAGRATWGI
jgi:hypothetical protein